MARTFHACRALGMIGAALLAGCSGGPGGDLIAFPNRHRLIPDAKIMRQNVILPQPLPTELSKTTIPVYLIEPGDVLVIEPADLDSKLRFPPDQTVLADGTIDLNQLGRLHVVNKSVEDIRQEVEALVKAKTKETAAVNVRLVGPQSKRFYVLGEVNSPGDFPYIGRETALSAILTAGGITDKANVDKIILSRPSPPQGCRTVLPICYNQIVQLGDTSTNYQIMPGDRIFVPTRSMLDFLEKQCHKKLLGPCQQAQNQCPIEAQPSDGTCGAITSGPRLEQSPGH